jgi:hypothetical protein
MLPTVGRGRRGAEYDATARLLSLRLFSDLSKPSEGCSSLETARNGSHYSSCFRASHIAFFHFDRINLTSDVWASVESTEILPMGYR